MRIRFQFPSDFKCIAIHVRFLVAPQPTSNPKTVSIHPLLLSLFAPWPRKTSSHYSTITVNIYIHSNGLYFPFDWKYETHSEASPIIVVCFRYWRCAATGTWSLVITRRIDCISCIVHSLHLEDFDSKKVDWIISGKETLWFAISYLYLINLQIMRDHLININ